jgi:acetyl esterase/lipase
MQKIFILLVLLYSGLFTIGQPNEILLWPGGAPGSAGKTVKQTYRIAGNGERFMNNINEPSITAYIPSAEKSTGVAIIIAPGGGHRELRIDNEGHLIAKRFQEKGIAAYVLKYRLAYEPGSTYTVDKDELADMQRAIRLIKSRAEEWSLDTTKLGIIGFSAGGELAELAAMKFATDKVTSTDPIEQYGTRPAFYAMIYPGGTKRFEITDSIPPVFLAAGYKDRADITEGIVEIFLKYRKAGRKAELHIYSEAGHGFSADPYDKNSSAGWLDLFIAWLTDLNFLKK